MHEFDADTVSHRPGGRLEFEGVQSVNVEGDPVVFFTSFPLEIVLEVIANVGEVLTVADLGWEAQDLLWLFRVWESSGAEVAEVLLQVNAFPVFHVCYLSGEDGQAHVKVLVILLGIDPEELGLGVEGLGASDGADRLGVVAAEDDGVVAVFESCVGLSSKVVGYLHSVVLGGSIGDFVDLLILRGEGTWTLGGVLSGKADTVGAGGPDFLVLNWDFIGDSEVLEPVLVLKPLWSAGGSFVVLATGEWVAKHLDFAD